ncbi:MAG TPA: LysR family transcriptional regulator [Terriglobales bacterium]|nr:LysR family transcriptional regulator [Terriglobales bacterium]
MRWDDLKVFLAVAQAGSLRRAAKVLRLGQPTVARHVRELEKALGARLFERTRDGHQLTAAGHSLLPLGRTMADAAHAIDRRRASFADERGGTVRVVANEWAARLLAPRLGELADAHPDLTVSLAESHLEPDLDRREADLFIRHGLPARGNAVRLGLGTLTAAIYGAVRYVDTHPEAGTEGRWRRCAWVAYDAPHEYFGTMAWLGERLGDRKPRVRASRLSLQLEALRAGAGLGILPCFLGDAERTLVRLTSPIDELAADYWLLQHPDLRTVPRVRRVARWIVDIFGERRTRAEKQ